MKTKTIYYIILLVYILLWACELVVCHMTHSLIILTDSYINLYKILEISLGLIHLCTQQELRKHQLNGSKSSDVLGNQQTLAGRLFSCVCSYQFKRLPLLGSFMNGLFLAALLMSAAIEGIQTCVHSSHLESDHDVSILHKNTLTYPMILGGFALVGIIMQQCSLKAHELREEELQSESLLDINTLEPGPNSQIKAAQVTIRELSANNLHYQDRRLSSSSKSRSNDLNLLQIQTPDISCRMRSRNSSLQELSKSLAGEQIPNSQENCISLRSLKFATNLESIVQPSDKRIGTISQDLEALERPSGKVSPNKDNWVLVRFIASPAAMLIYGTINYYVSDDFLTEIFDATLSICVVSLLFAASYPPMIRAGRVLLQAVPDGVDLTKLKKDLMSSSENVLEVKDLYVWSLTPRSNRVATCQLVLDKNRICDDEQVKLALCEARYKFLDQNVKCTTIEPVLRERVLKN